MTVRYRYLCPRITYEHEVTRARCTVNFIVTFIFDVYNSRFFDIKERVTFVCSCNLTFNGNIHRLCRIGYIDLDWTSISPLRDLVIAAFGDGRAFKRDRFGCCIFLRSYAIFRRTPPPRASALTGRTDVIMHAASTALMNRIFCFFILKTSAFC